MIRKLLEVLMIYLLCSVLGTATEFTFESKLKEVTAKPDAKVVYVEFDFENKSDETITIINFDAPCICMGARLRREDKKESLVFEPGVKATLIGVLEFENFKGTIDKVIEVRTDKDKTDKPSIVLTCRVTIPVLIGTDKEKLTWEMGSKLEPKEFKIKVADESETPIKIVKHMHGFGVKDVFDYEIETIKEGSEYLVTVTPLKTDEPSIGVVKFYTDSKIQRYKMVQIFLMIDHPQK